MQKRKGARFLILKEFTMNGFLLKTGKVLADLKKVLEVKKLSTQELFVSKLVEKSGAGSFWL